MKNVDIIEKIKKKAGEVMLEQGKFMEMLKAMTEVAKVQENKITKEEIREYFAGMELQDSQYELVYEYLGENGITVPGYFYQKKEEQAETNEETGAEEENCSPVLSMYMEEIQSFPQMSPQEKMDMFLQVRNKEKQAKQRLLEGYLPVVVEMANKYKGKGMLVEDLIQEGNIGLFQAIERVGEISNLSDADTFIIESIRQSMVEAVDEEQEDQDWEASVLAKTGLIGEAAKYLAEDLGRVATLKELAEFTKLSEEEIESILPLSVHAVEVGNGEK